MTAYDTCPGCGRKKLVASRLCQGCYWDEMAAQHGTDSGYHSERRAGLPTCDDCRAAHAKAEAVRAAKRPRRHRPPQKRPKHKCRDCAAMVSHSAERCRPCAIRHRSDEAADAVTSWSQRGGVWRAA